MGVTGGNDDVLDGSERVAVEGIEDDLQNAVDTPELAAQPQFADYQAALKATLNNRIHAGQNGQRDREIEL